MTTNAAGPATPGGATAVIIYANSQKPTYPATILSWRPVVLVGLLSYSLYLWHWPILALWKYWFTNIEPSFGVLAIGASFTLAYLSWRFVETPFRRGGPIKKVSSVVTAAAVGLVVWRRDAVERNAGE